MLEKYYLYRIKYIDYIIIIKYGNFYETFDKDALIINKLFDYKINKIKNTFKVGFPISSINNVILKLNNYNINYVVIDNENIINNKVFDNNNYNDYSFNIDVIRYNLILIDSISKYLTSNVLNENISEKLYKIKEIIDE